MNRRNFTALVILTASLSAIACTQALPPSAPVASLTSPNRRPSVELTVSAAASVQDAMRDIQVAYQEATPQVTITYNFGSSGSLAQQITQGAPVDVFLSASPMWMDDLESKGEIMAGSRQNLLQNAMTLVVPKHATDMASFQDLSTDRARKIAMGEPESVPAGQYAKEVLAALDIFEAIQPKLVFAKDVRQVLAYVETGNVDAGLVYATDAQVSDRVQAIATAPATSHAPIIYPLAVVQDSDETEAAQAFVEFLASAPATAIFQGYGFGMAE
ncbi:MAG: molybdate ABC transporter substrate-binding protein [Leptolyngbya sp. SIOISBB]|nr:molybdate ABC transporter substrate-binding protein [Leptolyngbya sp. SIOISBB]